MLLLDVRQVHCFIAWLPGRHEFESVKCNAISPVDSVPADPELGRHLVIRRHSNTAQDENEAAENVETITNLFEVLDQ
jgi:hypothetical protein